MVGLGREFRQGGGCVHVPENLERARPCSLPYLQQQVVEYTYAACLYDHVRIGGASDHLAGGVYGCGINLHTCPLGRINVAVPLPVIRVGLKEADPMRAATRRVGKGGVGTCRTRWAQ